MFVLNQAGTPSVARIAGIGVAGESPPGVTPVLQVPGDQSLQIETSVSLRLAATDSNGETLTFDGVKGDSGSFVWSVTQAPSTFALHPPPIDQTLAILDRE